MSISVFNLSSLNGHNGFRLDGVSHGDYSGFSVSNAGDINGDGFTDVVVSASTFSGGYDIGTSYVVFGKASGFGATMNLSSLDGSNGFRLLGDYNTREAANAGDINGDGFDDVVVSSYPYLGLIVDYVVFGKAAGFSATMDLSSLDGSNGFRLTGGGGGNNSEYSVSSAGDINGDGFDDLIVGNDGEIYNGFSYVVFGKASGFGAETPIESLMDGSNGFILYGTPYDDAGVSVSGAGDVNGDGFDDLLVGNPAGDVSDGSYDFEGSSYVVFGKASGFNASMQLASLDGSNGFRLNGEAEFDRSGFSVSGAGDVNGDGYGDVIIGAIGADPNGQESGSSYVVFGQASGFNAEMDLSSLDGSNGFRLNGEEEFDRLGESISSAGDVNGDGFDDLIIGASRADPNGYHSGACYVVFGKVSGFNAVLDLSSLDGNNGFRVNGMAAGDLLGISVSNAGDVNGDGFDDLIVGAVGADPNGDGSGSSYVIFGSSDFGGGGELPEIAGTSGDDVLRGTSAAEIFEAGDGNDVLIGNGGADVFHGGAGVDQIKVSDLNFDFIDGGAGNDILHLAGANLNLDLAALGDNIQGIETICIYGRGDNTLTLNAESVLNLSDTSNTLKLHGNAGDRVTVQDDGWVDGGVKGFYHMYTHDDAVLLVGANLAVDFA